MRKLLCVLLCVISAIYSVWYASLGGFSGNDGALSKIGLEHPFLFAVWGILTVAALAVNIVSAFINTKYKFFILLLAVATVGMAMTLIFDFDYDIKLDYYLHCIGSLTFSAVMGVTVFLIFLLKKSYIFAGISAAVLFIDLILLIIYKETAIIELAPIFAGYIMLSIHNSYDRRTYTVAKRQT